ncbi:GTPase family protein [Clostridium botulinum]|uniref:GTPase family protein n=1 Tax=Clostridium botulinum TaxID=1491 RepID=UPI001C9B1950|nr:GTPase [Clostridium botulinum]MBY6809366.1 50S ribosome-binding GTPase [Clostridium botulinum]MBY6822808.1 50S ribosome-binding GTPase [Clostridium botulinum]MBY6833420.1 50S ribosome-binding GTPase [Clostridium botulinum]MBY6971481.1 50S ribosome-binding GTPase [Clostridium botulinum]HBJ1649202.1 50S ribosome-binding GTPase [Clostridium botulinum]
MSLTVHINHSADINELATRYKCFEFLKNTFVSTDDCNKWYMTDEYWNLNNDIIYQLQVMFIGKTGYGKSTTLNKIVGRNVFESSDVEVCTKDLYSANYKINKNRNQFLALSDLPGIGESNDADNHYYEWYRDMLQKSHCVVYVLRADQRDFAVDEILFREMFNTPKERDKVILALNYADKIEPLNRKLGLSVEQISNLNKKIKDISRIFNMPTKNILYYSAMDNINMDVLAQRISDKLKNQLY